MLKQYIQNVKIIYPNCSNREFQMLILEIIGGKKLIWDLILLHLL